MPHLGADQIIHYLSDQPLWAVLFAVFFAIGAWRVRQSVRLGVKLDFEFKRSDKAMEAEKPDTDC